MLGLSANLNYYLFNGNVDLRKGIFRLCESIREEMSLDPSDASNVYMFMSRNRKVVKILHYERGFYVLYEKRPVMHIPADTRSAFPVISVQSPVSIQCCWQS
jgi:transposase